MVFEHSDPEVTSASGRSKATVCQKEIRHSREGCLLFWSAFAKQLLLGNTRREFRYFILSESLSISLASLEKFIDHVIRNFYKNVTEPNKFLFQQTSVFPQDDPNACRLAFAEKANKCSSSYLGHPRTNGGRCLTTTTRGKLTIIGRS